MRVDIVVTSSTAEATLNTKRHICRISWTLALACAALVAGCAQTAPGAAGTAAPRDDSEWEIVLTLSGGFAGLSQRLVARSPDGVLMTEDLKRSVSGTRMLSAAELAELGALLAHADAPPAAAGAAQKAERGPRVSVCADCINYEITIRTRNAFYDALYDSSNLGGSPDELLIQRLGELARQAR